MGHRAKKVDANQPGLVQQLRRIPGISVFHTHTLGSGVPDIVVGYNKNNYLLEIKDPSKPPSARRLTKDEERFHLEWTGQSCVVETVDDVMRLLKIKA